MSHIKTREKVNGIKVLDKGAVASERMRSAFIRTKQNASALVDHSASSDKEYSSDSAQNMAENTIHDATDLAVSGTKTVMRKGREHIEERIKQRSQTTDTAPEGGSHETAAHETPTQPTGREPPRADASPDNAHPQRTQAQEQGKRLAEKRFETRAEQTKGSTAAQETRYSPNIAAPEGASAKASAGEPFSQPTSREPMRADASPQRTQAQGQGKRLAQKRVETRRTDQLRGSSSTRQQQAQRLESTARRQTISQQEHTIKTADRANRTIKQTAKSTGRATVKSTTNTVKASKRTVKSAEQTSKMAIKTTQATAKAAQKTAAASAKAAKAAAQAAKATARAVAVAAKTAAKAVAAAVKAIIAAVKELIAAIAAGGWVAVLIIVVVVLIVAVIASPFGIFFSGESSDNESVPASAAIAQINYDFNSRLEAMQDGSYDDIVLDGSPADWTDVLAVFAVKVAGAEDASATYVASLDASRVDKLKAVFYDMTSISSYVEVVSYPDSDPDDEIDDSWSEFILHITVTGITAEEAAANYRFSDKQKEVMTELLAEREMLRELIGDLHGELAEAKEVLRALPADLSPERREIVKTACSLVGKVNYFWGGKSRVIGWDSRWGTLQKVWADGSSTTGTYRPYGLDCSGFVDWVFYNATDGAYYPGQGGGAADQHANSISTTWESAQPGDLVFYPGDEHVGIVAGFNEDGDILIIHCASGYNNVVITGIEGFVTIASPANLS